MKIIVLHGEDIDKLYKRLEKFIASARSRDWEVNFIDESPLSFEENLTSSSLFGDERFFILKNIKLLGKKEIAWLYKKYLNLQGNLIIYSEGTIPQAFLKTLPKDSKEGKNIVIEEFKLPVILWSFLDNLIPGNVTKNLKTFHELIKKEPVELVFSLITKLFRDLYWIKKEPDSLSYPFWRLSKLKSQANKFKIETLEKMIEELAKIDGDVKTGKIDLITALDLFIIKSLE